MRIDADEIAQLVAMEAEVRRLFTDAGFEVEAYLGLNPDVEVCGHAASAAMAHYIRFGIAGGRPAPFAAPLAGILRQLRLAGFSASIRNAIAVGVWSDAQVRHGAAPESLERLFDAQGEYRPVLVIGDSHSHLYHTVDAASGIVTAPLQCTAGSARGLVNRNSRSGYGAAIRDLLARVARHTLTADRHGRGRILFMFGQVDVEFVFDFTRVRSGVTRFDPTEFAAFARVTADRYFAFLDDVFTSLPPGVAAISSILPPTLGDAALRDGYVIDAETAGLKEGLTRAELVEGLRQLTFPDLRARTIMSAVMNDHIRARAEARGLRFVDAFSPMLGDDGLAAPMFVGPKAGADHHGDLGGFQPRQIAHELLRSLFA